VSPPSASPPPVAWRCEPFAALSLPELYELLALRQRVFVVEQRCLFQDLDGRDQEAWHLLGRARDGALLAYARLLPPGSGAAEARVGRVVTAPEARGTGLGWALMREALRRVARVWGPGPVRVGAQAHLERFYAGLGFVRQGAPYDEDGIPHLDMVRPAGG
jgi:ElaA protein